MRIFFLLIVLLQLSVTAQNKYAGSYGLDPKVQTFLEDIHAYTGPPIHELPLVVARRAMENLQKDSTLTFDKVVFKKELFKKGSKEVNVVIVKPKKHKKILPVLVYFHGGGWAYNSFETHKRLLSDISAKTNMAIVFVEYSRSPEAAYPIANEEGYFTTLFIAKNGEEYGLDATQIYVGGDSVGGNMATAITMMAKERKVPEIKKQVLVNPVTDANFNTQSYQQFSKGHYLSRESMQWFWDIYAPNKHTRLLATVAPLKATKEELLNLPKALIITAEFDVLRDEGEAYANKLRMANVPVISTRYGGTIHDFLVLNDLKDTEPSKAALEQICNFLKNSINNKRKINF